MLIRAASACRDLSGATASQHAKRAKERNSYAPSEALLASSIDERRRSVESIDSESPKESEALRASESPTSSWRWADRSGAVRWGNSPGRGVPPRRGRAPPRGRSFFFSSSPGPPGGAPRTSGSGGYRRPIAANRPKRPKRPIFGPLDAGKSYGIWGVPPIPRVGIYTGYTVYIRP